MTATLDGAATKDVRARSQKPESGVGWGTYRQCNEWIDAILYYMQKRDRPGSFLHGH